MTAKFKYNVAAPWEQYSTFNVSEPEEAVRSIFEIDQRHPDKKMCLLIFQNIFSRVDGMAKAIQDCESLVSDVATESWKGIAEHNRRVMRGALYIEETKLKIEHKMLVRISVKRSFKMSRIPAGLHPILPSVSVGPVEIEEDEADLLPRTPRRDPQREELDGPQQDILRIESRMNEINDALSRSEPSVVFTTDEIQEAQSQVTMPQTASQWTNCLKIIFTCVLRKKSTAEAELAVKAAARARIQNCRRGDSLLDFALELEKSSLVSNWLAKIFQPEIFWASEEQTVAFTAYEVLERSMTASENDAWLLLDKSPEAVCRRLPTIIAALRNSKGVRRALPEKKDEDRVLAVKRAKTGEKIVGRVLTEEKTNFSRTKEYREPEGKKKKKAKKEEDEEDEEEEESVSVANFSVEDQFNVLAARLETRLDAFMTGNTLHSNTQNTHPSRHHHFRNNTQNSTQKNNFTHGSGNRNFQTFAPPISNFSQNLTQGGGMQRERPGCKFQPCTKAGCTFKHAPGQHTAGSQQMAASQPTTGGQRPRDAEFTSKSRCRFFHDLETCGRGNQCRYTHGRSAKIGEKCQKTNGGMCEEFYSNHGCPRNHSSA